MHQIIFISYSREDREAAEKIVRFLESGRHRCWITPRDIPAGDDWAEAIINAIDNSEAVVLVLSASSNSSPHVRREIEHAVSICRKIIPVVIENVKLSKWMKYCISVHQWHDACTGTLDLALPALEKALEVHETDELEDELKELSRKTSIYLEPSELRPVLVVSVLIPATESIPPRRSYPLIDKLAREHSGVLLPGDDERRLRCFFGLSSSLESHGQSGILFAEAAISVLTEALKKGRGSHRMKPFGVGVSAAICEISWLGKYPVIRGSAVDEADRMSDKGKLLFSGTCADFHRTEKQKGAKEGKDERPAVRVPRDSGNVPLTGRQDILESLAGMRKKQRISAEMNRRGGAVHITLGIQGEPGVGKTRLISEFLAGIPNRSNIIHFSPESGSGKAEAELSEFLLKEFRIPENHWRKTDPEKADEALSDHDRVALYSAIRDRLVEEASAELILVIDDAQKLNHSSRELLKFLVENTDSPKPIFFIFLYRKTDSNGNRVQFTFSESFTGTSEEKLLPLSEGDTRTLAERTLKNLTSAGAGIDDLLASVLFTKTGGNPFFVIEVIENCLKAGHLKLRNSRWELMAESDLLTSSMTLATSLNATIDSLPESWKRALQVCAAAGDSLPVQIVNRLKKSLPEEWFSLEALNYLTDRQYLLREQTAFSDTYRFRHDLLREAALSGISEANRRNIHLVAAESYASIFSDNDKYYPVIAEHYSRTEVADQTLEWAKKALNYCIRLFNYEEALHWIGVIKGLNVPAEELTGFILRESSILGFLGRNTDRIDLLENQLGSIGKEEGEYPAELLLHLGQLRHEQGNHDIAERELRRACSVLGDNVNNGLRAEINLALASLLVDNNQPEEAESRLREACSYFEKEKNEHGMARVNRVEAERFYRSGELNRSVEVCKTALDYAVGSFDIKLQLSCLSAMGRSSFKLGQLDKAAEYWQRDIEIAGELGYRYNECVVTRNLGAIHHARNEFQEALGYYRESYDMARELDDKTNMGLALINMTHIHIRLGNRGKAEEILKETIALAKESGNAVAESKSLLSLATLKDELGEKKMAEKLYMECIDSCRKSGARFTEATATTNLAGAMERSGNLEKALEKSKAALALFKSLNENSAVICAQTNLASIQIALGLMEEAYQNLMEARSLSERINDTVYRVYLLSIFASYFINAKEPEKALPCSEESYEASKTHVSPAHVRAYAGVVLANVRLTMEEDLAETWNLLDELEAFCEGKADVTGEQASIMFLRGLVEHRRGNTAAAEEFFSEGMGIIKDNDISPHSVTGLDDLRMALSHIQDEP